MTTELHHDLDLERALLGALAVDSAAARASMNGTSGADLFHKPAHAFVYEAIVELDDAEQYIDVGVLVDHLRRNGLLDTIGGVPGILDACRLDDAPPPSAAGQLAERLGHLRRLRRLQHAAVEASMAAQAGDADEAARRLAHALSHDQAVARPTGPRKVDWDEFWTRPDSDADWIWEPILPRNKATNLYAPRGVGKSELILAGAAALATGRPTLARKETADPLPVVYLDLEMGEDDLYDRLRDLGYGPDDDLSNLNYYCLPQLPPMNTPEGGNAVLDIVRTHGAAVVVTDTLARVATGEENSNDTWIGLATHTILRLKAEQVTSVWLGHAGKDIERGERGGSAKGDAVDCIWKQTRGDSVFVNLTNEKRRAGWVPEQVALRRVEHGGTLRYEIAGDIWPSGTNEVAVELDHLGAPLDISRRAAETLLRAHDAGARSVVVAAALKWRRQRPAGVTGGDF